MYISLFASSVREKFYETFFKGLDSNSVEHEVVFAGNAKPRREWPRLRYIPTGNIKPAQCYEVARRACKGTLVMWVADDCEFSPKLLDKICDKMEYFDEKTILSVQTKEDGRFCDMKMHSFYGGNTRTPRMAPLGVMSRKFLDDLGGLDRRYVCGQYENDIVMRAYLAGGEVKSFGDKKDYVDIEHLKKHGRETKFWTGYPHDRRILETSYTKGGYRESKGVVTDALVMSDTRYDSFEPYLDVDLLTATQSFPGRWRTGR